MSMRKRGARPGAIVPLTALCLIVLLAFVALALDLGLLMIARNQCQNAADASAMAGARTLNGDTSTDNNYANVTPNANAAAAANQVLGTAVNPGTQLTVTIGDYYYDTASASFKSNPTGRVAGNNWTLVQSTVTAVPPTAFSQVLGMGAFTARARATAAHRPRDAAIVVDFSGSMRFESMLGSPHSGSRTASMNPDTIYPSWGHYSGNASLLRYSADVQLGSGEVIGQANTAIATASATNAVIAKFYGDTTAFGTTTPAFTKASDGFATTPGGDVPLKANKGTGSFAKSVSEHVYNDTTSTGRDWRFELDGYAAYAAGATNATTSAAPDYTGTPFRGYTQGPGYWGKTFATWPPDPRVPLTAAYYTNTQIRDVARKFLGDFGYTNADFANTSVLGTTAFLNTTSPISIRVPTTLANTFPLGLPFKIMAGTISSGAFTGTPEILTVTAVSAASGGTVGWTVTRSQDGTPKVPAVTTTPFATFNTSATTVRVNSVTGFPSAPFKIMVGNVSGGAFTTPELMTVTAVNTTTKTFTVTRGVDSTSRVSGTLTMTVALARDVGLLTAPALYGVYTPAVTDLGPTVGITTGDSSAWTDWADAATLSTYLTTNVYEPGGNSGADTKLLTTDPQYLQTMRLFNRNGGPGMPKNGSNVAMPADWRARFFLTTGGAPLLDSSRLYDSAGAMRVPRFDSADNNYRINYPAVLDWIKNCGPNPFPAQLRAGGIVYYTSIPTTIPTGTFPPADPNQRFWKEYIDEVLGVQQTGGTGGSVSYSDVARYNGYGDDFSWGTPSASGQPSGWPTTTYARYTDNPERPKLRMWFGPLSLIDFIGNYNADDPSSSGPRLWWPGTVPETPTYQTKLAIQAALKDILQNHPNDNVSLVYFSSPRSSATAAGYYNTARAPMGRDARTAINALWFSPKVIATNAEISVYDASGVNPGDIYDVPRANGGTCYSMGLMLAYNQFSANTALVSHTANALPGTAGGLGRNGAAKLLVFETDGVVNTGAAAALVSSTTGQGYYAVRLADANDLAATGSEFPTGVSGVTFATGASQSQAIAQQLCNDLTAGGFSTTRKPVKIHCIAFGSLFDAANTSSSKTNALSNLAALEVIGKVQASGATTLAANKIIVGDYNTRIANLQNAFNSIMQDGVQVTLISSGTGQP
ncbi:MAG: pilus assembly protein TadG-related protein [Gemmataceae bacterium]